MQYFFRIWDRQKIYTKLVLACLVSAVLPMLVLSFFSFSAFSKILAKSVMEQFDNQIFVATSKIQNTIDQAGYYLKVVMVNPMVPISFTQYKYELYRNPAFLEEARENFPNILQIKILSIDGNEVISTLTKDTPGGLPSNRAYPDLVESVKKRSSEILITENVNDPYLKRHVVTLSKCIFDIEKKLMGVLSIDLDPVPLFDFLKQGVGKDTSFGFVFDNEKDLIFSPVPYSKASWRESNLYKKLKTLSYENHEKSGLEDYFEESQKETYTFLFRKLPMLEWGIGIAVSKNQVYGDLLRFGGLVFFATLIMIGLATGLAIWLSQHIASRLKNLSKALGAITKGNYDQSFEVTGSDELSELGRVFEFMRRSIGENTKGLYELIQLRQLQAETEKKRVIETEKRADEETLKKRILQYLLESTKGMASAKSNAEILKVATQSVLLLLPLKPGALVNLWFVSSETGLPVKQSFRVEIVSLAENTLLVSDSEPLQLLQVECIDAETWANIVKKMKSAKGAGYTLADGTLSLAAAWEEKVHGMLSIHGVLTGEFSETHRDVLTSLLQSMRVCMDNVEYLGSMQEGLKRERELEAAKTLQKSLMPVALDVPELSIYGFYQAAQETGGDWYGYYYDSENHRLEAYIGDVTGHGFASSLLTGVAFGAVYGARSTLERTDAGANFEAEERLKILAEAVNRTVLQSAKSEKNMTMAFVSLDLLTGQVHFLNAGHNLPFVVPSSKSTSASTLSLLSQDKTAKWTSLKGLGARLGAKENPEYTISTYQLQAGEAIFMYTDGLLENTDSEGKSLNLSELRSRVQAHSQDPKVQCEQVCKMVERLCMRHHLEDDVAVLILNWKAPITKTQMCENLNKFPFGYVGKSKDGVCLK